MKVFFRGTALVAFLLTPFVSPAQTDSTLTKASPAPVVMLKPDDLVNQSGTNGTVPPRWQKLVDFLETEKIKGTIGILTESLEGDCPAYCDWLKHHTARGYIELWNHGYYRKGLPEALKTADRKAEYLGGTVAEQPATRRHPQKTVGRLCHRINPVVGQPLIGLPSARKPIGLPLLRRSNPRHAIQPHNERKPQNNYCFSLVLQR